MVLSGVRAHAREYWVPLDHAHVHGPHTGTTNACPVVAQHERGGKAAIDMPLAAFCILATNLLGYTTQYMAKSWLRTASSLQSILFRHCVFANEVNTSSLRQFERGALLRVVEFERTAHWTPQNQCVLKILSWLSYARETLPGVRFVGWLDNDVWMLPSRLETFLKEAIAPLKAHLLYGGAFEHAQDYYPPTARMRGFSFDWQPMARYNGSNVSFPFSMGAFTFFNACAADVLLAFLSAHPDLLKLANRTCTGGRCVGKCIMPTDVGIGWLAAKAFADALVACIDMQVNQGTFFAWPSFSTLSPSKLILVHNGNQGLEKNLDFYNASAALHPVYVAPVLRCFPRPWAHTRTAGWSRCIDESTYTAPRMLTYDNAAAAAAWDRLKAPIPPKLNVTHAGHTTLINGSVT